MQAPEGIQKIMAEDSQEAITLPHSLDAEVSLLGSLMLGGANSHSVMGSVKGDEFYLSRHRIIYDEMLQLWADGGVAEAVMLNDRLRASGGVDKALSLITI